MLVLFDRHNQHHNYKVDNIIKLIAYYVLNPLNCFRGNSCFIATKITETNADDDIQQWTQCNYISLPGPF